MQYYANQKRIEGPTFKEGDKVYLVRRNIKTKRPSDKLDYKKLGPFLISEVISKTNYRLSLPETIRIHPVFHISLLEPAHPDADTKLVRFQDSIKVIPENEEEYEVEQILDTREKGRKIEYLIHWKGYRHDEDTWEPLKNLTHCQQLVRQFHLRNPDRPKPALNSKSLPHSNQSRRRYH